MKQSFAKTQNSTVWTGTQIYLIELAHRSLEAGEPVLQGQPTGGGPRKSQDYSQTFESTRMQNFRPSVEVSVFPPRTFN